MRYIFPIVATAIIAAIVYHTLLNNGEWAAWLVFLSSATAALFGATATLMWLDVNEHD